MTFDEIKELVTALVASLGGITGIIAIINGVVRVIAAAKTAKATRENTGALGEVKAEMVQEIKSLLNCSLDVDISAKLNSVLEGIENKYLATAQSTSSQLSAMRELCVEMAQMMSTSRKLSEDERLHLIETIGKCNSLIVEQTAEVKPKLLLSMTDDLSATQTAEATQEKRVTI